MTLDMDKWIREMAGRFPGIHFFTIGESCLNTPIHALTAGHGPHKVLVNACHHANEWITALLAMHFMEEYADRIPESATLCVVPMVNPDGVDMVLSGEKNTDWKANARGVDLNANYPAGWELAKESKKALGFDKPGPRGYMGPYPLSEPESRALANLTRRERFDVTLSLHTQGEEIYWRYGDHTPPGSLELAKALTYVSGYALENAPVESAHAGYKDWFIQEFNKPGFTVECGLGENPLPVESLDEIYPKVEAILRLVVFQQFQHDF